MRSALENWQPVQLEAPNWGPPTQYIFHWSEVDQTTGGKVQFLTTVDIDAATSSLVRQDALNRMLCVYIVGHLSGKALGEAGQSLADIYSWQMEQTRPFPQISEQKRHAVSQVRRVERIPFSLDED